MKMGAKMTDKTTPEKSTDVDLEPQFLEDIDVKFSDYGIEDYVVLVIFWTLSIVVFAQFFSRYVLNDSIAWTEETARYLLIAVAFAGVPIGVRKSAHIHVEFFYRFLSRPIARVLSTVVDLIRTAFFLYATVLSYKIIGIMHSQRMTAVDVPMSVIYAVVLAGLAVASFRSIQVALKHWKQGYSILDEKLHIGASS